jgi:hypothetical protein
MISPDWPDIAWIAADEALNPGLNERFAPEIPKTPEQTCKLFRMADYNHLNIVAFWLRGGKCSVPQPQSDSAILRTLKISGG